MTNAFTSDTEREIVDSNWGTHLIYYGRFNAPVVVIHIKAWDNLSPSTRMTMKDVITFSIENDVVTFDPIKTRNFTKTRSIVPSLISRAIGVQMDLITSIDNKKWLITDKPTILFMVLKYG